MKSTYNPQQDVAYIHFREKRAEVESLRISVEPNMDLAPDRIAYGD